MSTRHDPVSCAEKNHIMQQRTKFTSQLHNQQSNNKAKQKKCVAPPKCTFYPTFPKNGSFFMQL
jgi:hypothetical protein